MRSSILYKDLQFNKGIPDKDFEFILPEGARVVEREIKLPKTPLEEAQGEADPGNFNFNILPLSYLPGSWEFNSAPVLWPKYDKSVPNKKQ